SQDISGRSFRGLALGQKPTDYDANCPFPGLLAFQARDQAYFFSREELIAALEDRLREHNFLALLGPSASGKSSLVQAGLLPALKQQEPDLQVVYLKPGSNPPARLAADLEGVQDGSQLLIVDQFEELFTECPDEQMRRAFLDHLFQLVNKMRVVIVMRADYWGDCAPYRDLVEKMQAHQALVAPMNEAQLRNAMERQRGAVGLHFEADLANTMLDDVRGEPGAMPLLQHALRELWQRRHGIWLKASEYRAIGKAQGAIAKSAGDLYDNLSPEEQNRVRDIFVRLTRLDDDVAPGTDWRDTRRRATMEELVPADRDPRETESLVNRLATAQLVVVSTDPATRKAEVEVSHEALIRHWSLLGGWLEKDRQLLQLREGIRRSALEWEQGGRKDDDLLHRGERLGRAQALANHPNYPLNERELTYVESCTLLRAEGTLQGLRSAVQRCEPADPWLDQLREEGGQALIRGLEEPIAGTSARLETASTPSKVEALLGLDGDILPRQPEQESAAFGPVAWSAVSHDQAVTRQTAALALTLPYGLAALDRLEAALSEWAQQTQIGSWKRRRLRSELRGSLAEIDAEIESLNAGLPRLDRLGIWLWRVRRRVIADRHRIFALVVGAAIAAGLILGSYRGLLGVFAGPLFMTRFATSFFWGVILGAAVGLGIGLAKPMALEPRTAQGEAPPI
ncbi:MAG TPA: hypothetical protein VLY63_15450, partial [Anaerolineae bacterium]|nr:hypothetical protein [Anaerolineae bacterium]